MSEESDEGEDEESEKGLPPGLLLSAVTRTPTQEATPPGYPIGKHIEVSLSASEDEDEEDNESC